MKRQILISVLAAMSLATAGSALADGDAAKGEALAKKCVSCHGPDGKGVKDNPSIVGLSAGDFAKNMHDYKSGARKHTMMNVLSKKLSDDEIEDLAAYYATLK